MKTPKFLSKLSAVLTPRPKKRLHATARTARPAMDDYHEEEPTTKLSSAFFVVLILHVVAVGGIYAFNSIKASRREREATSMATAPVTGTTMAKASNPAEKAAAVAPPPATAIRTMEAAAPGSSAATAKSATGRQYEVKSGDNLTKIAFAYGVTTNDITAANQLKEGAVLRPGQILAIPAGKSSPRSVTPEMRKSAEAAKSTDVPPTKTKPGSYTVKQGDTLTSIARRFGLTTTELSRLNKITDPKKLQLGQVLKVPPRRS